MAGFPALEALVKLGGSRAGEVALTVTRSLGGLDMSATGGKPLESGLAMEMARVVEAFGLARLTWNGEGVALRTMPMQRFGAALVAPPPGAFLQATEDGEAALLAAVAAVVGPARRIVDLPRFRMRIRRAQERTQRLSRDRLIDGRNDRDVGIELLIQRPLI